MECCHKHDEKMMTIDEVSEYLNISKAVLYTGVRLNTLGIPHIKINKAVRFMRKDLDDWINMQRERTGPNVVAHSEGHRQLNLLGE